MSEKTEKKDKPEKPDVKVALATFNERFMAGLIDWGIVFGIIIIGVIFLTVFNFIANATGSIILNVIAWLIGTPLTLIGVAAYIVLMVWMPYKKDGQSFGKKKQNIKIMIVDDEEKWTLRPVQEGDIGPIIVRALIGGIEVTFIPVVIAWYFITNDKNRQRLADQVAKTVVVQVDPEKLTPLKKPRVIEEKKAKEEKPAK